MRCPRALDLPDNVAAAAAALAVNQGGAASVKTGKPILDNPL